MNRFLKNSGLFILPVISICICMEILLRNIPNDYSYKKGYLDKHSKNIKILFLGTSHALYGLLPEHTKDKSFNAAHNAQTINFDWGIIKKYSGRWDLLKYIVIPIDYATLYGRLENSAYATELLKYYIIHYGIYNNYNLADNYELFNNNFETNLNRIKNYYLSNRSNITCTELGAGPTDTIAAFQKLKNGKERAILQTLDNTYFLKNIEILEYIAGFAKEKNIQVILFTTPAYKTYVEKLDPIQLNSTINAAVKIKNSYSNVSYINLLTDQRFAEKDFGDADHLNALGAKKLTLIIDSIISCGKLCPKQ